MGPGGRPFSRPGGARRPGVNLILPRLQPAGGARSRAHLQASGALRDHQPRPSGRGGERRYAYGGLVFPMWSTAYHAGKAIAAGVDGIIAVSGGAGAMRAPRAPSAWCVRSVSSGAACWCSAARSRTATRCGPPRCWGRPGLHGHPLHRHPRIDRPGRLQADAGERGRSGHRVLPTRCRAPTPTSCGPASRRPATAARELVQGVGKGKLKPLTDEAKAWRDMWSAGHGWRRSTTCPRRASCATGWWRIPGRLRPSAQPGALIRSSARGRRLWSGACGLTLKTQGRAGRYTPGLPKLRPGLPMSSSFFPSSAFLAGPDLPCPSRWGITFRTCCVP